jgi:hypothetical protein
LRDGLFDDPTMYYNLKKCPFDISNDDDKKNSIFVNNDVFAAY